MHSRCCMYVCVCVCMYVLALLCLVRHVFMNTPLQLLMTTTCACEKKHKYTLPRPLAILCLQKFNGKNYHACGDLFSELKNVTTCSTLQELLTPGNEHEVIWVRDSSVLITRSLFPRFQMMYMYILRVVYRTCADFMTCRNNLILYKLLLP